MVAVLVRLKLSLLANAFRRSVWQVVGLVLALVYGLSLVTAQLASIPVLARQDAEFIESSWVIAGSLAVAGWALVPIFSMGADMTLDPRRFAPFGVSAGRMLPGLGIATLVGVPGAVTLVVAVANAFVWKQLWYVAAPCALAGVALCVVASRVTTIWVGRLLGSRAARWAIGAAVAVPVIVAAAVSAHGPVRFDATVAPRVGDVLGWTPIGAPWAVTVSIARGEWGVAIARSGITVTAFALLVWAWWDGLRRAMENPAQSRTALRSGRLSGVWRTRSALGAVAARCLTYWLRDARYAAGLAMAPIVPIMFVLATGGRGLAMLALGPALVFLVMWSISADVGYDGSAFWMQIGLPGFVDRAGRVIAASALAIPLGVASVVGSLWSTGRWDLAAPAIAVTVGTLGASAGLASVLSAVFVYPVPAAGENPFSAPSGTSAVNLLTQLAGWAALMVVCVPFAIPAIVAIWHGGVALGWVSLALAVAVGGGACWAGLRWGGRLIDRNGPELLAKVIAVR